jgi:DNA-directed RNA polymerase specialized sigma24 family protein
MGGPGGRRREDEVRIVALLEALLSQPEGPAGRRKAIEEEIFTLVDRHFREVLKPLLLARFGAVAGEGGAARYTAMANDFFTKVLEHRHDEFWRAGSATELRKWASVVISNQIRDYLRREHRYKDGFDAIAPLVEERRDFFKQKTGVDFTIKALDLIDDWCGSEDDGRRLQGWVLRHRFVGGMTRDQIGDQLNVSVHTIRKALETGIVALRVALND